MVREHMPDRASQKLNQVIISTMLDYKQDTELNLPDGMIIPRCMQTDTSKTSQFGRRIDSFRGQEALITRTYQCKE